MREHMGLFRGKRIDNGEWVEGYLFGIWEKAYILWGTTNGVPNMLEVDPETIGECTGHPDKYGKLIFEGDVFDWGYAGVHDKRYVVAYDAGLAYFVGNRGGGFVSFGGIDIEIIGNIHDNPELLKGGEG